MVPLLTVGTAFQARVLAARLGSEGIVTELRGAVDGPYPFGDVGVLVEAGDLELARSLLLADEVESAFSADEAAPAPGLVRRWSMPPWVAIAGIVLIALASTMARLLTF
jgi:hypothetical protein